MHATSVLFVVASFVWVLPAIALLLLYLEESYNVPIAGRIGEFCRLLLSRIGAWIDSSVRSEQVGRHEMLSYRAIPAQKKAGKNLHAHVENATPVRVNPTAYTHQAVVPTERDIREEGFVAIEAVWKRKDAVVEVERWMLGVN